MLYGPSVWDPVLIIAQIVALQCIYNVTLGVMMVAIVAPYVPSLTLYHLFDWRWVGFHSFQGWMVATACTCNAFVAAVALRYVVQRAKKCLDFASTLYFIHFATVAAYSGFPTHIAWWIVNGTNLAITAVLGEWMCMQKELQEIPLAGIATRRPAAGGTELTSLVVHNQRR